MRATLLQAAGALSISTGLAWFHPAVGLISVGIFVLIFGIADERGL